jgi:DNA-binding Lrp family transcriptional regulator
MDSLDRRIINELQIGFPVCERPFMKVAKDLGTSESELVTRLRCMLDDGLLTRFGPLFNVEEMGGAVSLCAMQVPASRFDEVADNVNAYPQVAHNYQRDHNMNMWFVLATETSEELEDTIKDIENDTGLPVFNFPKQKEYFVGLHFHV